MAICVLVLDQEEKAYELNLKSAQIGKDAINEFKKDHPNTPLYLAGAIGPTNTTATMSPDVNRPEFRNSPAMPSVHYMSGLALTMVGRFEEAKPLLGAVLGVNVKGLPLEDPNQVKDEEMEPEDQPLEGEGNETE